MGHVQRDVRQRVARGRLTRYDGVSRHGDWRPRSFGLLGTDTAGCDCEGLGAIKNCAVAGCAQPALLLRLGRGDIGIAVKPASEAGASVRLAVLPVA